MFEVLKDFYYRLNSLHRNISKLEDQQKDFYNLKESDKKQIDVERNQKDYLELCCLRNEYDFLYETLKKLIIVLNDK